MSYFKSLRLLQGGMGIGVSGYKLVRAVNLSDDEGRVAGIFSGVAYREVFVRTLQLGDQGGDLRRAMKHFPGSRYIVRRTLKRYFRATGKRTLQKFLPTVSYEDQPALCQELDVISTFCGIWLSRNVGYGRKMPVGLNLLEKAQVSIPSQIFGAILAGVDFIVMGAGNPSQMPELITRLSSWQPVKYRLHVDGALTTDEFVVEFDPSVVGVKEKFALKRPLFGAIVSSYVLAKKMQDVGADFLVVEAKEAGGHNAPPRNKVAYGEKDEIDWQLFKEKITIPYFTAGLLASKVSNPNRWQIAKERGAQGIQAGSIYSLTDKSGLRKDLRQAAIKLGFNRQLEIRTDSGISSSGYPFKVAVVPGTVSDQELFDAHPRGCTLFFLKSAYRKDDGTIGWRCSGGNEAVYEAAGGDPADCVGRGCLCSELLDAIGLGNNNRFPVLTLGDDAVNFIPMIVEKENGNYNARQATRFLLQGIEALTS